MALLKVFVNGKERRLSQLALDILGLDKVAPQNKPIAIQKLPPNLEILKIQKAEPAAEVTPTVTAEAPVEAPAEPVVEVKKNEDVTAGSTNVTKRRRRGKVGTEK